MIDLYYATTPNGRKPLLFLEEVGLPYRLRWVHIAQGQQHEDAFRALNPNGKIPVIVDPDGPGGEPITLFESGAILLYLAEKTGQLLAEDPAQRYETIQWVFWQMANQGPMLGQATHFTSYAAAQGVDAPYATERYQREARKTYEVLEGRLADREWIVGDAFSIADIACWPWVRPHRGQGIDITEFPAVQRWSQAIATRPAAKVKPKVGQASSFERDGKHNRQEWDALFGKG
jgi:GST-like protein